MMGLFGGSAGRMVTALGGGKGSYLQDPKIRQRAGLMVQQPPQEEQRRRGLFGRMGDMFSSDSLARTNAAGVTRGEQLGAMLMSLAGPQQQTQAMQMLGNARARGDEERRLAEAQREDREQNKLAGVQADQEHARRYRTAIERGYSPELADMYAQSPDDFFQLARNNYEAFTLSDGQERFGGAFGGRAENPDEMLPYNQAQVQAGIANIQSQIADRAADNRREDARFEREAQGGAIDPNALRVEFEDDYARPFETAQDQFASMRNLAGDATGASDTALIFSFFKTIDPSSTVREGEFALAAQAMGLSDRLVAQLRRADNGQILVGDARDELVTAASRALEQRAQTVRNARGRYSELAGGRADQMFRDPVRDDLFEQRNAAPSGPVTMPANRAEANRIYAQAESGTQFIDPETGRRFVKP